MRRAGDGSVARTDDIDLKSSTRAQVGPLLVVQWLLASKVLAIRLAILHDCESIGRLR